MNERGGLGVYVARNDRMERLAQNCGRAEGLELVNDRSVVRAAWSVLRYRSDLGSRHSALPNALALYLSG
jgi:hypothetical protein